MQNTGQTDSDVVVCEDAENGSSVRGRRYWKGQLSDVAAFLKYVQQKEDVWGEWHLLKEEVYPMSGGSGALYAP